MFYRLYRSWRVVLVGDLCWELVPPTTCKLPGHVASSKSPWYLEQGRSDQLALGVYHPVDTWSPLRIFGKTAGSADSTTLRLGHCPIQETAGWAAKILKWVIKQSCLPFCQTSQALFAPPCPQFASTWAPGACASKAPGQQWKF